MKIQLRLKKYSHERKSSRIIVQNKELRNFSKLVLVMIMQEPVLIFMLKKSNPIIITFNIYNFFPSLPSFLSHDCGNHGETSKENTEGSHTGRGLLLWRGGRRRRRGGRRRAWVLRRRCGVESGKCASGARP